MKDPMLRALLPALGSFQKKIHNPPLKKISTFQRVGGGGRRGNFHYPERRGAYLKLYRTSGKREGVDLF